MLFLVKSTEEILNNIEQKLINSGVVSGLDPNGTLALILRIIAEELEELYSQAQTFFNNAFVSTAEGQYLDEIGKLLNCPRLENESDEDYRYRITRQAEGLGTANEFALRNELDRLDFIMSYQLVPYTHGLGSGTLFVSGEEPLTEEQKNQIMEAIEKVKAFGTYIDIAEPDYVPVGFTIKLYLKKDSPYTVDDLKYEIIDTISAYILSLGIGDDVVINEIIQRIMDVNDDIYDIEIVSVKVNGIEQTVENITGQVGQKFIPDRSSMTIV